jgi:hypothetical protein
MASVGLVLAVVAGFVARADERTGGLASITPAALREWLGFIASDELDGRATFSEGLGIAGGYIAAHLQEWGVRPAGDRGTYFQRVPVRGVRSENRSTLTVEVDGQSRTFKQGEGIEFQANVGAARTLTADAVEFVGYGLEAPGVNHNDLAGIPLKGKVVVWLGDRGPQGLPMPQYRRALGGRSRNAIDVHGAAAAIGVRVAGPGFGQGQGQPPAPGAGPGPAAGGPGPGGGQAAAGVRPDFTTAQRLDNPIPPSVIAGDELFEFLFSGADTPYAELKQKAAKQEPLPRFTLRKVKLIFALDAKYTVVRTQYTHNVVGTIEGSDPKLRETFVAFGAHYDHVGYAEGEILDTPNGPRRQNPVGRVTDGAIDDRVWNGADDDGSGTVAIMGVARAFALGPKPKRSLLFVWHAGEERGLWGSRYYADYPGVPLDRIVAQLNLDMVGRNRDGKTTESSTVYPVGSDRISTELHQINEAANAALPKPLTLDYEMNDPADLEQVYFRSDHYSYAAKGIPVIFFTTGLHQDYHTNTDNPDRIEYDKLSRVAQLVYETGRRVANLDHAPVRDNRGPRAGRKQ